MVSPHATKPASTKDEKKEEKKTETAIDKHQLLLTLSANWSKFTRDEQCVLIGLIGFRSVPLNQELILVTDQIMHRQEHLETYHTLITEMVMRHQETSAPIKAAKEKKLDEEAERKKLEDCESIQRFLKWAVMLLPLIILILRFLPGKQKEEESAEVQLQDLMMEKTRLERKISKKKAKAERVQKYINRVHGPRSLDKSDLRDHFQEIDRVYRVEVELDKKLNAPRYQDQAPEKFVKGTDAYERQQKRLDADLDDYFAKPCPSEANRKRTRK